MEVIRDGQNFRSNREICPERQTPRPNQGKRSSFSKANGEDINELRKC